MASNQPIQLRRGVSIEKSTDEYRESPYCLRDAATKQEWSISARLASFLLWSQKGGAGNSQYDQATIEHFTEELQKLRVLKGQDPSAPSKSPLSQKLVFPKITFVKPDAWLKAHPKLVSAPFHPVAYILLMVFIGIAILTVWTQVSGFLSYRDTYLDAAFAIVVALALTKTLHEFGHAFAISHAGGQVDSIGIALIAGMPLPKTDGSLLSHANRKDRIRIALAGVYFELWAATIAIILWGGVEDGIIRTALHSVAVVSLSMTVVGNALPLMKFDGYHLISAIKRDPRLYEDAIAAFRCYAYAVIGLVSPERVPYTGASKAGLALYGAAIFVWKVFLPFGIVMALRWMFPNSNFGYLVALIPVYAMWLKPGYSEIKKMKNSESTNRAWLSRSISASFAAVLIAWFVVPIPHTEIAQGAMLRDKVLIKATSAGRLLELHPEGYVAAGSIIANIHDDGSPIELARLDNQQEATRVAFTSRRQEDNATALLNTQRSIEARRDKLRRQIERGVIVANESGFFESSAEPGEVSVGTALGYFYPENGDAQLTAYVKTSRELPMELSVRSVLPDGRIKTARLQKMLDHASQATIPKWLALNDDGLAVYVANETYDLAEMPVQVFFEREYSIAREFFHRYLTRFLHRVS